MKRLITILPAIGLLMALAAAPAQAAAPPGPYFNGFEKNTNGWFDGTTTGDGTITREPSGYTNGVGGYANGIASASGRYHARLGVTTNPGSCLSGSSPLPQPIFYGPYTNWGGYSSTFPTGGYRTDLDIYLDVPWAETHSDRRFDWSSAINDPNGNFRRDFVFNAGTDPLGFVISTGNNANRCGANPADAGHQPIFITQSGWYTFQHAFNGSSGGPLSVTFTITQKSTGIVVGTWTRSDPSDVIGVTVGGNRYGWFVQNEIQDLAIDNSLRTGFCHQGDGEGDVESKDNNGKAHSHFHGQSCENQQGSDQGDVEHTDSGTGTNFQSTSVTAATFTYDEDTQTLTMVGTGVDNGLPVGFTMVAVDSNGLVPGVYSLVLTDGYAFAGSLVSGSLSVQ